MNDPGHIAEQGEEDVQPELEAYADLQENPERREQDRDQNADNVQGGLPRVSGN